jgi:NAD+ synthase
MQEETINIPRKDHVKTAKIISRFIEEKVKESHTSGVVIGLSGGLDSSTTAYLCAKTIKTDQTLGIIMPSATTHAQDVEDAIIVAESLGMEYEIIHIDELISPFNELCIHATNKNKRNSEYRDIANANLKARIRMMILYYHANALNRLVVGTGNRTELLVGYFTKYGDGGVDILPIGDLYKTDVKMLASQIGVPNKIIEKPPTAGLWAGQTDEEELGIEYDILDKILYLMVDRNFDVKEISKILEIPLTEVLRIEDMLKVSGHKLKPAPYPEIS